MTTAPLCATGIAGLDAILGGGLPPGCLYAIEGAAGSGKTTFGLQFLLEGVRASEKVLYISLSETTRELANVATSHGWTLDGIAIMDLSAVQQLASPNQSTVFNSSEVELNHATRALLQRIEQEKPKRVVFDSLFELRLLAQAPIRYRRQMLALKQALLNTSCTVLLLEDAHLVPPEMQVENMVNGVISLTLSKSDYGSERRRLTITKVRGASYVGGTHDLVIKKGGLEVFPRLVADAESTDYLKGRLSSGVPNLDSLLGGGLDRGTSTLLIGPAGSGKSVVTAQYAYAAAERGERVVLLSFEESTRNVLERAEDLGVPLGRHVRSGVVTILQVDPAELTPGELAQRVIQSADANDLRMVVFDSLNGYMQAMPQERFLLLHLHELLSCLGRRGIVTIMTLAQHGLVHDMESPANVTYLSDTVILLRYFEAVGTVRKAISVIKKRNGPHENTIRELSIVSGRLTIGDALTEYQGVLTGIPVVLGNALSPRPNASA